MTPISDEEVVEMDSFVTSATADFYEFRISNDPEAKVKAKKTKSKKSKVADLEPIE